MVHIEVSEKGVFLIQDDERTDVIRLVEKMIAEAESKESPLGTITVQLKAGKTSGKWTEKSSTTRRHGGSGTAYPIAAREEAWQ